MLKKVCDKCGKTVFYDIESIEPTYCMEPTRSGDISKYIMTPIQLLGRYKKMYEIYCTYCGNYIILENNKLFVCPDQPEELEVKATDLENTEIAKSFEQELRAHNQAKYDWWQKAEKND